VPRDGTRTGWPSAGVIRLQEDPAWRDNLLFVEYVHGGDGAGVGAMHQTGRTALVVHLLLDPPGSSRPVDDAGQSTAT
jgi:hypothetical protein